jgi:hypothetical protein
LSSQRLPLPAAETSIFWVLTFVFTFLRVQNMSNELLNHKYQPVQIYRGFVLFASEEGGSYQPIVINPAGDTETKELGVKFDSASRAIKVAEQWCDLHLLLAKATVNTNALYAEQNIDEEAFRAISETISTFREQALQEILNSPLEPRALQPKISSPRFCNEQAVYVSEQGKPSGGRIQEIQYWGYWEYLVNDVWEPEDYVFSAGTKDLLYPNRQLFGNQYWVSLLNVDSGYQWMAQHVDTDQVKLGSAVSEQPHLVMNLAIQKLSEMLGADSQAEEG